MKVYCTLDSLIKDLPYLKDVVITIGWDFERTIYLDAYQYRSILAQMKRQNIKVIKENRIEDNESIKRR